MSKKKITRHTWLIIIANILLAIYIAIIGIIGYYRHWTSNIWSAKAEVVWILIVMFIFELLSTITFQVRIWLTSKDKITLAAIVGSISWCIAGLQGLLLINGDISGLNEIQTFFVKMPSVLIATFVGILANYTIKGYYDHKKEQERNYKYGTKSRMKEEQVNQ